MLSVGLAGNSRKLGSCGHKNHQKWEDECAYTILGGSWVVISVVISPLILVL